ncbi:hypothetical protein HN371_12535 [Candidatus Poribacteria bacterium]|nr:hypothetical protein [Candidatus Poribacteria bacterium]MBT5535942.1 hypothetical protein [Candidatus Poribacteria bacterium]MBT7096489.1 hypothetical protein [Candidatus Poribacteria bacterium]MBT7805977.1 hypothetical protein [Candidatus Poribacteria bacterium]
MSAALRRAVVPTALTLTVLLSGVLGCEEVQDAVNPDPDGSGAAFRVRIENVSSAQPFTGSGVFNTPVGAAGPGPLAAGEAYEFGFTAGPGSRVSFATMFVQSNDLFYAPAEDGIALYDASGAPTVGDVTDLVMLWDAGVEVNEEPGVGANQAPRQAGPNTGDAEGGQVQLVADGFTYPAVADAIAVTVSKTSDADFSIRVANVSDGSVLLAPGVWVVHADGAPLFAAGSTDRGDGLEALAEDGDPSGLGAALADDTGIAVIIAPGVWVLHTADGPLFTDGAPDRGLGLEALAEDGDPSALAAALGGAMALPHGGAFTTPVGAAGPAPAGPGGAYEFVVAAVPGARLSLATMYVQSNDLFYGTDERGIALFDQDGVALSGDVTSDIALWDAGSEVNEAPGFGPNQAPRQAGPDTGADEGGAVRMVADAYDYGAVAESIRVSITAE